MTRLYIIGPVTGIEDDNIQAFADAQLALGKAGIPSDMPHSFVPKLCDHERAMLLSIHRLTERNRFAPGAIGYWRPAYQGVALLDGWEQSEGARLEKLVAEACGIPCKTVAEWIEEAGR